ncbi:MAG: AmmeMemoRadiSam system protein B [Candidatus Pacearchaeota archaeon]
MRKAIVSGQFYLSDKSGLNGQVESCFFNKLGPGSLPKAFNLKARKLGLIVPHAGYPYSGACAAWAYKALMEVKKEDMPETFIIFGPCHSGYGKTPFSLSLENFETPLGLVKNNIELGNSLIEALSSLGLQQDEAAHKLEHSIEVQLPFLQFCYKLAKKEFRIVPIVVSSIDYDSCAKLAMAIAKVLDEQKINKKVCVIASSDFTHYGLSYGFLPFTRNVKENLYALDKAAISLILKLDSKNFYKKATSLTICGYSPIVMMLELVKELGAKKAELLKYYTSGDVVNDYSSAVGYASIVIE